MKDNISYKGYVITTHSGPWYSIAHNGKPIGIAGVGAFECDALNTAMTLIDNIISGIEVVTEFDN